MPRPTTAARSHHRLLALLAVLVLLLAACSSDDEGATTATDADDATEAPTSDEATDDETGDDADDPVAAAPVGEVATADPVPSAGCGTSTVGSVELEKTFVDDSDRWYLLTTPLAHDGETPLPLVLDFHGLAEGAEVHALMSGLAPFADANDFVVVMPHGTESPVRWNFALDREGNPDVVYVDEVLDQLEAELCIDTSRIYSTGLSNGAFMSSTLGCVMSDRIAAIAPVAGVQFGDGCAPERPVPTLTFHGTEDAILLFNGGIGDSLNNILGGETPEAVELPAADLEGEGYPAAIAAWAEHNGCEATPADEDLTETVLLRTWDCPAEGATEFAVLDGGGHTWPGSEFSKPLVAIMGATDDSIDANELIWAFFQRFALPAA